MKAKNFEMTKIKMNYRVKYIRENIRRADRKFKQIWENRSIQQWIDNSSPKVVVVDNRGEEDSVQYGQTVDRLSPLQGWGYEPEITASTHLLIVDKEEQVEINVEKVESMTENLMLVQKELGKLYEAAKNSMIEHDIVFPQDQEKIDSLEKWEDKLKGWIKSCEKRIDTLNRDIKAIEEPKKDDPDDNLREEKYNVVHWKGVSDWGERMVVKVKTFRHKYSVKQLIKISQRINQLRYGDSKVTGKRRVAGKQLTFKNWVELYWLINAELYKRTKSNFYQEKVEKAKKMYFDNNLHKPKIGEFKYNPEASFCADCSLNEDEMIQALDKIYLSKKEITWAMTRIKMKREAA